MTQPAPRLLLIDDHDDLAEATAAFLRHHGFEVQVVQTGKEAIQTAAKFIPEIVLCDISLPDMSGLDVGIALKTHAGTGSLLFALHSAMRRSDIGLSDLELQAKNVDLFFSKPLQKANIETMQQLRRERPIDRAAGKKANTL